jgi:integrase
LTLQITLQMDCDLARKIPYLLFRDGRYFARRTVAPDLRPYVGTIELREPLGADRKLAIEKLPVALVQINAKLDHARRAFEAQNITAAARAVSRKAPMTPSELARTHYNDQLALDEALRDAGPSWASISIDDAYVADLRAASSGSLQDDQLETLLGSFLKRYALRGNIDVARGTPEWRKAARAIAEAELEVLARLHSRDEGIPAHEIVHPPHLAPVIEEIIDEPFIEALSLRQLLEQHLRRLEANGGGLSARKGWTRVFEDLLQFLRVTRGLKGSTIKQADDARRLTAEEVIAWRDRKLETLSPKTVKDVWLASLKSVLSDAVADRLLPTNVAKGVRVRMYAAPVLREKGFTDAEALAILERCREYQPATRGNPANRESEHVTAAKRWGPWLCAFTGARVTEILQLRKSDVRAVDELSYVHITPEAGSVKSRKFRDVPLHQQLIDIGFLEFVEHSADGPLFHSPDADPKKLPAQAVSGRVGKWLQSEKLVPVGVQPNHGWRHRFKTLSREAGLDPHVVDSIQGHTGRTASDGYGDVTLRAKKAAIDKLLRYEPTV